MQIRMGTARPARTPRRTLEGRPGTGFLRTRQHSWVFTPISFRKARDVNHCDFHYSHLLPKKPGILPLEETMTKKCRRCAAEFVTRSRIRKRCDACQTVVSAEKQKKANERLKARRAARRMCLVASG
jgi:hypothetical protein